MTVSNEQISTGEVKRAVDESKQFVERLANADSLPLLSAAFGSEMPENYSELNVHSKLSWFKGFANEHLDTRRDNKERQDVGAISYTPDQEAAIAAFTQEFAMEGETNASQSAYGFISILGGANQSNLLRVAHAKKQLDSGVQAPYLLLLGSARPVSDKERANVENYAPNAQTEFDEVNDALEAVFGVVASDETTFTMKSTRIDATAPEAWKIRYYDLPNGTKALSVSAPQIEGSRRANTADTYRFIREIVGVDMLQEGQKILACTTDFYVPFQHADILRLLALPAGVEVETIGYGGVDRPAKSYAGEINSVADQAFLLNQELSQIELAEKNAAIAKLERLQRGRKWTMETFGEMSDADYYVFEDLYFKGAKELRILKETQEQLMAELGNK